MNELFPDAVYRPMPAVRWVVAPCLLLAGGVLAWGVSREVGSNRLWGMAIAVVLVCGGALLLFHVRLELWSDRIVIWNVLSHEVAYRDITGVDTPPSGQLQISTAGRTYRSFAGAKDNISRRLGRRTQADDVVDEIRRRVQQARGQ